MSETKKEFSPRSELAGISLVFIGLLLGVSLLTYSPSDPSFSTAADTTIQNAVGRGGAVISDLFFQFIGIVSYFIPVGLIVSGIRLVMRHSKPFQGRRCLGFCVIAIAVLTFAEIISQETTYPSLRGGALGSFLSRVLNDYLGWMGTDLLLLFSFIVGGMLVFPFSISNIVHHLLAPLRQGLTVVARSVSRIIAWNEKRLHSGSGEASPPHDPLLEQTPTDVEQEDDLEDDDLDVESHRDEASAPSAATTHDSWESGEDDPIGASEGPDYKLPPLSLLLDPPPQGVRGAGDDLAARAKILKRKLSDFGVMGEVRDIHPGPVVTLFEFEPAPGIKLARITSLADDLALAMRASQVRIVPRLPGKPVVGIEVPNRVREDVFLKEILSSSAFTNIPAKTRIALGKDIGGLPIAGNLAEMPHLLIAGATGSGKSVGMNTILLSLLFSATPSEVKLLLVDPKMLELSLYDNIPHLFSPVITSPKVAAHALRKMVEEMQRRYQLLSDKGVRNIESYNKLCRETPSPEETNTTDDEAPTTPPVEPLLPLPYIIVFIDELADLMVVASSDVEESIGRLAQMARAAGIHLVLATQRPSVDVLTGVIKANFTARIAYAVTSKTDSRTILDANGAEQLLGKGDMLCLSSGTSRLMRIHGAYVSEEEVKRVTAFIREQGKAITYEQVFSEETALPKEPTLDARDELYQKACALVTSTGQASASFIQRRLRVGYPRAARMIELMEEDGLIGPAVGSKPREILVRRESLHEA